MNNLSRLLAAAFVGGLALGGLCAAPGSAQANENNGSSGPYVAAAVDLEVQNDNIFSSDDPTAEINDLFFTGELGLTLGVNENFALVTTLVMEPVLDPRPSQDRFFGDHGLFAEEVFIQLTFDPVQVVIGKINPAFGKAWDETPGIYGTDFAEDYELAEMIGAGGAVGFALGGVGSVEVAAFIFFVDTTFLSNSVFTKRGRTRRADGGAGNTEEPNNFAIAVDGSDIPSLEGFAYHIAFRHLSAGLGDVSDENGLVFGVTQEFSLHEMTKLTFIFELANLWNAGGGADDVFYATLGSALAYGPWHGEISSTLRDTNVAGGTDFTDWLFQVSAGRELFYGVDASIGYKFAREAAVESHTFGILVTKSFEYDSRS